MSNVDEKELLKQGMEEFKQGNLPKAERIFRDFLLAYPQSDLADNAAYNLAKICMKKNDTTKALEWVDYVLQHYPQSDAAYFAKDEQIELLRQLGKGPKETPDELYFKGKQAMSKGKTDEAEELFNEFIEKYVDSDLCDNAHYNLALINKQKGKLDAVRHHVDVIMNQYPDSDAAIYARDLLK